MVVAKNPGRTGTNPVKFADTGEWYYTIIDVMVVLQRARSTVMRLLKKDVHAPESGHLTSNIYVKTKNRFIIPLFH